MNNIDYQIKTLEKMITLYCRLKHGNKVEICDECSEVLKYAHSRLQSCPYKENKPECKNCNTHCYNEIMREKIRGIMRYTGPRMLIYSPVDYFKHVMRSKKPLTPKGEY